MKHKKGCLCCAEGRNEFLFKLEEAILQQGNAIIQTETDYQGRMVTLVYSIGLSDIGLPEIVTFGLPAAVATHIINDAAKLLREGKLALDTPIDNISTLPLVFKAVTPENAAEYIIQANHRLNRQLPAIQMIWPDKESRFPWEKEFDKNFQGIQPHIYQNLN